MTFQKHIISYKGENPAAMHFGVGLRTASSTVLEADVARRMLRSMPERAVNIIISGDFAGSNLVKLASDIHRPSFKDPGFII